ncbi:MULTISPECIES: accessory gene regulator ArgB-like protein [unclassified Enterococcus]|uniref:accessory gene regulator ArgB-like protein n=1 Tax=unclassified Enterococcus TaxID=2608891 RepID=UPI001CE07B64|nr:MULTISPECIES: accessory gene regulator AgrB [unclassified Enterococcus]MCA5013694.1 accessory gene regulator AgrB [Enterococcus sp. S23]MCA5016944.1 accessory gene regulator AgrB [Enterococcus sp. S22(2020)]
MHHTLSLFLLEKKLKSHHFLSPEELAYAVYNLEVLLINLEKVMTIYFFALIFQNISTTVIVHLSYFFIRMFAGGWHAQSSIGCTVISVVGFVFLPKIVQSLPISIESPAFMLFAIALLAIIWKYAPAGTEKKTITDRFQLRKLRWQAMAVTTVLLIVAYLSTSADLQILILLGLSIEAITIHPYFYQLMKRGQKND